MKQNRLWLAGVILLSLYIHFILATLPGFKVDVDSWFGWSIQLTQHPLSSFYSLTSWNEYTPGFLYVLTLLGFLRTSLSINPAFFYFILKLPGIISELCLGILTFYYFRQHPKRAKLAAIAVLFNPAFLFDSSIWGQIESILTLFLFLSLIFLARKKFLLSGIFWGLAFLIKPQAIGLLPVFLFYFLKHFKVIDLLKTFLPSALIVFGVSLPFFGSKVFTALPQLVIDMSNYYHYSSLFAYNLWGLVGFWINDSKIWFHLSYQSWGYLLFGINLIWIGYLYFKKNLSLIGAACVCFLAFYFLPTRVHERYLYPGLFFLLTAALERKKAVLGISFLALSITFTLNLYFVYLYYNSGYYHLSNSLFYQPLFNFLQLKGSLFSGISTLLFLIISYLISTTHDKKTVAA